MGIYRPKYCSYAGLALGGGSTQSLGAVPLAFVQAWGFGIGVLPQASQRALALGGLLNMSWQNPRRANVP